MDGRRHQSQPRIDFDRFVAETAERLLRSAYLITWDFAEAEDLVQECLFKVARRWPRVKKMEQPVAYRAHGAHPSCVGRREAAEPAAFRARSRSDRTPRSPPRRCCRAHPWTRRDEYRPAGSAQRAATAATGRPRSAVLRRPERSGGRRCHGLFGGNGEEHHVASPRTPPSGSRRHLGDIRHHGGRHTSTWYERFVAAK